VLSAVMDLRIPTTGLLLRLIGLTAPLLKAPFRVVTGLTAPLRGGIGLTKPLLMPTGLMLRTESRGLTAPCLPGTGKLWTRGKPGSGLTDRRGNFPVVPPFVLPKDCLREERPLSRSAWGAKTGRSEFRRGPFSFMPLYVGATMGT
jgi:hypothetical protein